MRCLRFGLHKKFSRYLHNELAPAELDRLEAHLLDCGWCRTQLTRLRGGHHLAQQIPTTTPQRDGWQALESILFRQAQEAAEPTAHQAATHWVSAFLKPRVAAVTVVTLVLTIGSLLTFRQFWPQLRVAPDALATEILDPDSFHKVSISDIHNNTEPHIVAEGYVSEVRIDSEDGDLTFRLVENMQKAHPFIVCEIITPINVAPPTVGSRVRVYGVSRYDGKENHQWYEVHPVLGIERVQSKAQHE